jgi:hypothetical protein
MLIVVESKGSMINRKNLQCSVHGNRIGTAMRWKHRSLFNVILTDADRC